MKKRYSSQSRVVLNIIMDNGQNVHLSFEPLTGGGSYYTTDNEEMQRAIESNANYRKTFIGEEVHDEPVPTTVVEENADVALKPVKVSSIEDAKDYLAEHFGYSRTKLRTRAACIAAGEENGIEFIWS